MDGLASRKLMPPELNVVDVFLKSLSLLHLFIFPLLLISPWNLPKSCVHDAKEGQDVLLRSAP